MYTIARSEALFTHANAVITSGVSTPVFDLSKQYPGLFYINYGKGSAMYDIDNNQYIDFLCGYGSLILGHAHPDVISAVQSQVTKGMVYCLPTENEVKLSELIVNSTPCIDQIRFLNSGTEAVMAAIRLAKYYTNRSMILKFKGSYHGHADTALGHFYPGAERGKFGIDASIFDNTLLATHNNLDSVEKIFTQYANKIAAVIIEPIACNMGIQPFDIQFLKGLRELCNKTGSLLIYDEVITGFRFQFGSVSTLLGVEPDLITFGKIIGGGTPVGAYSGRSELMKLHSGAYDGLHFAGTFSANPLTITAGLATLNYLKNNNSYLQLETLGSFLEHELTQKLAPYKNYYTFARMGSVFTLRLISKDEHTDEYQLYSKLHNIMLNNGFLMTPSPDETMYLSIAHTKENIIAFCKQLALAFQVIALEDTADYV